MSIGEEATVAEWSKAPDLSSVGRMSAWVRIPPVAPQNQRNAQRINIFNNNERMEVRFLL